jgi:hypothetical protein
MSAVAIGIAYWCLHLLHAGDLDANWVESMNSVMDDSRLLTLPSNERIRLLPHMKMIFEIRDLKYATPATATRAGILYVSEGRQWHNMVQSWLQRVVRPYAEKAKWKVRPARQRSLCKSTCCQQSNAMLLCGAGAFFKQC